VIQVPPEVVVYGPSPADMIPIAGMVTGTIMTLAFLLGPVGRAIGRVIQDKLGGGSKAELPSEELDELHTRLDAVTRQVAELAERQDFTDRMLAQVRKEKALPGDRPDVAG